MSINISGFLRYTPKLFYFRLNIYIINTYNKSYFSHEKYRYIDLLIDIIIKVRRKQYLFLVVLKPRWRSRQRVSLII